MPTSSNDPLVAKAEQLYELERQKAEKERELLALREIHRKQAEFDRAHPQTINALRRALVLLEHEQPRVEEQLQRIQAARLMFRELLEQLEAIQPADWRPESLSAELTRALAQIEAARLEYGRAAAKLALLDDKLRASILRGDPLARATGLRFRDWLKIGIAVTLPLLALGALLLLLLFLWSQKYTPLVGRP